MSKRRRARERDARQRELWREENARAAARLAATPAGGWTRAASGQVLSAFERHIGSRVTVWTPAPPDPLDALRRLADRIVSEG